jgi:NDP-hexose 2,3-enoyl reductase
MDYVHLGRSGLAVSRLCLGTLAFGPTAADRESCEIMDRAHEQGINFFDTSDVYGWQEGKDWSENIIGRWFTQGGGRRERTVIATKVFQPLSDWPNDGRLSAKHIRQACENSLRRLQTDYIDIYQMHHVDRETPWDEIWEAMEVLRTQGKILYVGSSNFAGWHIAQAQEAAKHRHFLGLISEQSIYNLTQRDVERELLPAAEEYGVGVITWSPLARGLLAGALANEHQGGPTGNRIGIDTIARLRPQLERYEKLCAELETPPALVALAWLLSRPGVSCPIIGPVSVAQLDALVAVTDLTLDQTALARLDEIFPGYKTAPEDYAW